MTNRDRDTNDDEPTGRGPTLTLDEGPIHEALVAIDRARAGIEHAKAAFRERREDFAAVFQAELDACVGIEVCECAELLGPVLAELYWEHPVLRVSDIAAATGLSGEQVRRLAGPKRCEVPCDRCGTPTEVLQTRRTRPPDGLCADCRPVARFGEVEYLGQGSLPPPPDAPPEPDSAAARWDGSPYRGDPPPARWYSSW